MLREKKKQHGENVHDLINININTFKFSENKLFFQKDNDTCCEESRNTNLQFFGINTFA